MLEAVLGKQQASEDAAAAKRRRGLGAAVRNAAVVAEAYPESEAHAGTGADGKDMHIAGQSGLSHMLPVVLATCMVSSIGCV